MQSNETTTTEQNLAAVIAAQVKGGHHKWFDIWDSIGKNGIHHGYLLGDGEEFEKVTGVVTYTQMPRYHILEVVLDPEGLKAAHCYDFSIETGDDRKDILLNAIHEHMKRSGKLPRPWQMAGHLILDSWLSGGSEAAINTAFSLLPKS